jgi:hypothetical protein
VVGKLRTEVEPVTTAVPKVTGAVVKVTVCDAGKFKIEVEPVIVAVENVTDGVPLIEAVTEPICAVPDPIVTPCVAICVKVTDGVPIMLVDPVMTAVPKVTEACENVTEGVPEIVAVTLPPIVTGDARSCASVRPPVIVTCPSVTVMFSRAFKVLGPSSTPETAVAISVIPCVPKDITVWAGI